MWDPTRNISRMDVSLLWGTERRKSISLFKVAHSSIHLHYILHWNSTLPESINSNSNGVLLFHPIQIGTLLKICSIGWMSEWRPEFELSISLLKYRRNSGNEANNSDTHSSSILVNQLRVNEYTSQKIRRKFFYPVSQMMNIRFMFHFSFQSLVEWIKRMVEISRIWNSGSWFRLDFEECLEKKRQVYRCQCCEKLWFCCSTPNFSDCHFSP